MKLLPFPAVSEIIKRCLTHGRPVSKVFRQRGACHNRTLTYQIMIKCPSDIYNTLCIEEYLRDTAEIFIETAFWKPMPALQIERSLIQL